MIPNVDRKNVVLRLHEWASKVERDKEIEQNTYFEVPVCVGHTAAHIVYESKKTQVVRKPERKTRCGVKNKEKARWYRT